MQVTPVQHRQLRQQVNVLLENIIGSGQYVPYTPGEAASALLLDRRNIVGFGYGMKMIGGQTVDQLAICAYVVRKADQQYVDPSFIIDRLVRSTISLPKNVVTDVIEVGNPTVHHHSVVAFDRRIPGGAGVSNTVLGVVGTLGAWLKDQNDEHYLLSCWHVLDGGVGQEGISSISQPDKYNVVGTLVASIPPKFHVGNTTIDAAVATLSLDQPNSRYGDFILNLGEIRGTSNVESFGFPIHVWKYGAASHLSGGKIIQAAAAVPFFMSAPITPPSNPTWFNDQLIVEPDNNLTAFSMAGDSGALLMTDERNVIGLIVGGITNTNLAVATPISAVMQALSNKLNTDIDFITFP